MTEIDARLIAIVQRLLEPKAAPEPFPADLQLSDLGISSLKMVNLMLAVEMEFDIGIAQEDITPDNFHSLATVARLVMRTLRKANAAAPSESDLIA